MTTHISSKVSLGIFFLLIFTYTPSTLFSQGSWKPARLHFYQGKKFDVEVRTFLGPRIPQKIRYRLNKEAKTKSCKPKDVSLIDFKEGKRYMRVETQIDLTPIDINKLKDFYGHKQVDTTILVRELVRGTYSLYVFQDANAKNHFFLSGPKVPFHELRYRLWWHNDMGNIFIERDFGYRRELMSYRKKCIEPFKEPFELGYRKKELTNFVESLNTCEFK